MQLAKFYYDFNNSANRFNCLISIVHILFVVTFFSIRPPPELLPVLGPLERYMTPALYAALLCSSRAGSDLGRKSDGLRSFVNWVSLLF